MEIHSRKGGFWPRERAGGGRAASHVDRIAVGWPFGPQRPEPTMSVPTSVASVLRDHVTLAVESIDRMYLNVYVPQLQRELGVVGFLKNHRGHLFASSALLAPISDAFIHAIEAFTQANAIPLFSFAKGQRKDDVAAEHLASFSATEGVLFVGKAQEKTSVFRTEKRRNPRTGQPYP